MLITMIAAFLCYEENAWSIQNRKAEMDNKQNFGAEAFGRKAFHHSVQIVPRNCQQFKKNTFKPVNFHAQKLYRLQEDIASK